MSSQVYKSKTEAAKKEYLKALAAYRASLVSKVRNQFLVFNVVCRWLDWKAETSEILRSRNETADLLKDLLDKS